MFNPFLIVYFVLLALFIGGVFAVIYHLEVYKFNSRISLFVSALFIMGVLILLAINIVIALGINWSELEVVF